MSKEEDFDGDIDTSAFDQDISLLVLEMHGDIKKIEQHMQQITNMIESNEGDILENSDDISDLEDEVNTNKSKIKVVYGIATFVGAMAGAGAAALPSIV